MLLARVFFFCFILETHQAFNGKLSLLLGWCCWVSAWVFLSSSFCLSVSISSAKRTTLLTVNSRSCSVGVAGVFFFFSSLFLLHPQNSPAFNGKLSLVLLAVGMGFSSFSSFFSLTVYLLYFCFICETHQAFNGKLSLVLLGVSMLFLFFSFSFSLSLSVFSVSVSPAKLTSF